MTGLPLISFVDALCVPFDLLLVGPFVFHEDIYPIWGSSGFVSFSVFHDDICPLGVVGEALCLPSGSLWNPFPVPPGRGGSCPRFVCFFSF